MPRSLIAAPEFRIAPLGRGPAFSQSSQTILPEFRIALSGRTQPQRAARGRFEACLPEGTLGGPAATRSAGRRSVAMVQAQQAAEPRSNGAACRGRARCPPGR